MNNCELVMTVEEMKKDRQAWLKARLSGIGGSEIAQVLGLSNYGDQFSLWERKTGRKPSETPDNEKMKWGRRFEPVVADGFAEDYGLKLRQCGLMRRTDKPWMLCSVDRLVVGKEEGVEIKTATHFQKDEWPEDGAPQQYYLQCQWYMACTGYPKWWLVCICDTSDLIVREIPRCEEDIKVMEEAAEKFWNEYVVPNKMPPDLNGSKYCTAAIISQHPGVYKDKGENVMELDGKYLTSLDDIAKLQEEIDKFQEVVNKKKNEIRLEMGDTTYAHAGSWNVSFKPTTSNRVDTDKLKAKYPNIYKECVKTTNSRTLRITVTKDPKRL